MQNDPEPATMGGTVPASWSNCLSIASGVVVVSLYRYIPLRKMSRERDENYEYKLSGDPGIV